MKEPVKKTKRGKWMSRCLCTALCALMAVMCANVETLAKERKESGGASVRVIDKEEKRLNAPKYAYVWSFSEGLAVETVYKGNVFKYGYIDKKGKEVIKL